MQRSVFLPGRTALPKSLPPTAVQLQRRWASIGSRNSALGFSQPLGRSPQVKQGPANAVARRVPGTTKVRYTNKKGRTFNFSIPVSEVMQAPVTRQPAASAGWKDIDTSFCDTGDLDEDMPSSVDESLRSAIRSSEGQDALVVDAEALAALQRGFVELCREYALMDTRGMKTTLTYRELHNGPDYELYDRKLRRRRHWFTIQHRLADIRELLWPTAVLSARDGAELAAMAPLLSAAEMLDALTWLEAASAFAIRTRRPYDTAASDDFAPIDLQREVTVLAAMIRLSRADADFFSAAPRSSSSAPSVLLPPSAAPQDTLAVDRFVTCVSLCRKHSIPLGQLWNAPAAEPADARAGRHSAAECRQVLLNAPVSATSVHQSVRVIHSVMAAVTDDAVSAEGGSAAVFCFCERSGRVSDMLLLQRMAALASPALFSARDALANVDENALIVLLQFAVAVQEANADFFATSEESSTDDADVAALRQSVVDFSNAVLGRARRLLYRLDGPTAAVESGEDVPVPLVALQAQAERGHPRALVHYNVGMQHRQGQRLATLEARNSARLLELVAQLENSTSATRAPLTTLSTDLVQHIAHKVATGKSRLTLDDAIRVLPHLGVLTERGQNCAAADRFGRLLSACAATIGLELQQAQTPQRLTLVAEGLAACGYRPSNLDVVHMALLRTMLSGSFPIPLVTRAMRALLQLEGAHAMPATLLQRAAAVCAASAEASSSSLAATATNEHLWTDCSELLALTRTLYYSRFLALPTLVAQLESTDLFQRLRTEVSRGTVPAALQCQYGVVLTFAAGQAEEHDPDAAKNVSSRALALLDSAWSAPFEPATRDDWETTVDSIMCLAALGVTEAPAALTRVTHHRPHAPLLWLHALCTPSLAVSVLESLSALHLVQTALFEDYQQYLVAAVASLDQARATARAEPLMAPQAALEDGAFEFLLRLLALGTVNDELTRRAGRLVLDEVELLASALSSSESNAERGATQSAEVTALARHEWATEVERKVLRGYAAIQANAVCAASLDSTA